MNGEREDSQSNKYQPPPNFKEVSVSYEHSGLTVDNLKDSHELWIIKLPKETDISTLVGAKFELGEKITITTEESEPLTCISSDLNCQDKYSLLLPSKKQGSFLSVPHRFAGKLDLAPSVNVIDSTEVNLSEGEEVDALQTYPEEIKQRFAPFGSVESTVDFRDDFNSRKRPKKIKSPKTNSSKKKDMNSDLKDSERSTSSWGQEFLEKISGKKERKRHSDFSESPEKKKKRRHSENEKTRTESPTKSSNFEDTSIKIENDSLQNSSPKKKKHSKKHKRKKSSDESSS